MSSYSAEGMEAGACELPGTPPSAPVGASAPSTPPGRTWLGMSLLFSSGEIFSSGESK